MTEAINRYDEPMSWGHIFFGFSGRIPRKVYWLHGVCGLILAAVFLSFVLIIAGVQDYTIDGLVNLLLVWPALAIGVKRWHDRDKSGWWVLVNFIPVIGWIWALIDNGFLRGTQGPNRFGEDLTGRI
ncbi:MAG TPA: DUF805 domain-containing protein [Burkholderiaceae bacterium]|jgi:uncharacterized membrane protein YhaH (DUF805 family)|nr:DUF805 domain-containing protein [Burkholderiaceae bacterium]